MRREGKAASHQIRVRREKLIPPGIPCYRYLVALTFSLVPDQEPSEMRCHAGTGDEVNAARVAEARRPDRPPVETNPANPRPKARSTRTRDRQSPPRGKTTPAGDSQSIRDAPDPLLIAVIEQEPPRDAASRLTSRRPRRSATLTTRWRWSPQSRARSRAEKRSERFSIGGRTSSVGQVANLPLGSGFPAEQAGWQPAPRRTCGSYFSADP